MSSETCNAQLVTVNTMRNKISKQLFEEAKTVLVGGVNSPVRSFNGVGADPLVMKYGKGSQLFDYDGNAYTDYCLSWGSLIFGHAHRNVVLAAKNTVQKGSSFGTTTRQEIDIAKFIVQSVPSIEQIRFVNSGTEATMSALRLARGFTKRSLVIKFDGCYHGHVDDLLTTAGSGVAALKESSSLGIPQGHIDNTISLPYNDSVLAAATIEKYKNQIAAVILEPVAGNMGVIPADPGFLKILRELTSKHQIVLIFDEIMTGFRAGLGCAQKEYDIIPDLTCLGKIIGGGFPVGAYGGRKDIMQCLAPLGGVYQAGTFSGNPVVMRSGLATLQLMNKDVYRTLNERCRQFVERLNQHFKEKRLSVHMSFYHSMMSIRFSDRPVKNYTDAKKAAGGDRYRKLFWHLIDQGIYWPPADLEAFFVSAMHTKKDLLRLEEALKGFAW